MNDKEVRTIEQLGNNIRKYRTRLRLSQNELAMNSGLHRNYISDLERGTRNPTFEILIKISDGMNISLIELLEL